MSRKSQDDRIGLWRFIVAVVALAGSFVLAGPARAALVELEQIPFKAFAEELLAGIGAANLSEIPALGGYGKPRIAVLPFRADDKTVPAAVASEFNTRLTAELTRQGSGMYRFVARESLKSIIREIDTITELDPDKDDRVAALMRNARVDILIVGAIRRNGDAVALSYKAVSVEDGTMFAATLPRQINVATLRPARPTVTAKVLPPAPRLPRVTSRPLAKPVVTTRGRPTVFDTQRMLARLGYRPGPIDGVLHGQTRAAIRAFQRDRGLQPTGRMTRQTVRQLRFETKKRWPVEEIAARNSALVLP